MDNRPSASATATSNAVPPGGVDVLPDWSSLTRRERRRRAATAQSAVDRLRRDDDNVVPISSRVTASAAAPTVPRQADRDPHDVGPSHHTRLEDRAGTIAWLEAALPATEPMVYIQLGLDNFRLLNVGVGPAAGDVALRRAGSVLDWAFSPEPVGRLGGDCFGVLLPYDGLPATLALVRRALDLLANADLSSDGAGLRATASAGITVLDRPGLSAGGVILEADLAMTAAKAAGRNRVEVHDALATASATAVHEWASHLRQALDDDAFTLYAQPVRSLRGEPDQWELLVRLPASDGELLPPAQFLPIAERFGLMQPIDELVTRHAVDLVATYQAAGQSIRLEVNIGESTLASETFVDFVEGQLQRTAIPPSALIFEVNASTAAANLDDVKVFSDRLSALGCRFAIDSFGRNGGALDQLKVLPLNFVKIDGSFIRHLPTSPTDQHIVRSLTDLAHSLGCGVIAMSVADDESRDILDQLGVDYVQGFHIGRPEPIESVA